MGKDFFLAIRSHEGKLSLMAQGKTLENLQSVEVTATAEGFKLDISDFDPEAARQRAQELMRRTLKGDRDPGLGGYA